jgi:hypothetical protein
VKCAVYSQTKGFRARLILLPSSTLKRQICEGKATGLFYTSVLHSLKLVVVRPKHHCVLIPLPMLRRELMGSKGICFQGSDDFFSVLRTDFEKRNKEYPILQAL